MGTAAFFQQSVSNMELLSQPGSIYVKSFLNSREALVRYLFYLLISWGVLVHVMCAKADPHYPHRRVRACRWSSVMPVCVTPHNFVPTDVYKVQHIFLRPR